MDRRSYLAAAGSAVAAGLAGCAGDRSDPGGGTGSGTSLALTAAAFDDGDSIPARYTCDADNGGVNPELSITGVVDAVESLALVVDDPDAPGNEPFVHWLLWNVPADTETVPRSVARGKAVDSLDGARQGTNSKGVIGYSGPCPPTGDGPHTYRFTLTGLDGSLDVDGGAKRPALESAMEGRVVAQATLTGTYERS